MKYQFLIVALLATSVSQAQNPTWQWARTAQGLPTGMNMYAEQVNDVAQDASGNVYVTGSFNSMGGLDLSGTTITSDANGNDDAFVAKYSPSGQLLWVKSYGGSTHDAGHSITIDGAGNVLLAGIISPSLTESVNIGNVSLNGTLADNRYTLFVAKLNPNNGNTTWAVRSNSNTNNYITVIGLETDANNNVYVAGHYYGQALTMGSASCNATSNQYFLFKLNSSGVAQFGRTITNGTNYLDAFSIDGNGNVYLSGHNESEITIGANTYPWPGGLGYYTMFLAKYNASGALQFFNTYGDALSNLVPTAMEVSSNGKVLVATHFYVGIPETGEPSSLTASTTVEGVTFNSAGGTEPLLLMFNTDGTFSSYRQLSGSDNDVVKDISSDADGNFYLIGNIRSASVYVGLIDDVINPGSDDVMILKYNELLTCQWALNQVGANRSSSISSNANGRRIYVGGSYTVGGIQFGTTSFNNSGSASADLYVAKLGDCTANEVTIDVIGESELCEGSVATIEAQAGFETYLWNNNFSSQSVTGIDLEGEYYVTVTDIAGCTFVSDPVTIVRYDAPELQITADVNLLFCESQAPGTVTTTEPFVTYLWYVDNEPAGTSSTEPLNGSATYMVEVTDANGCSYESDPVTYTMLPNPSISAISGPDQASVGQTTIYTATATNAGIAWEVVGGTILGDIYASTIEVLWNQEGMGQVTAAASNTVCSSYTSLNVEVSPSVGLIESNDIEFGIHPNPAIDFMAIESSNAIQSISILYSFGRVVFDTAAVNEPIRLDGFAPGIYTVLAKTANGNASKRLVVN